MIGNQIVRRKVPPTQAEMARKLGLSRAFVCEVLAGEKSLGMKTCMRLAPLLKTPWHELKTADPESLKLIFESSLD